MLNRFMPAWWGTIRLLRVMVESAMRSGGGGGDGAPIAKQIKKSLGIWKQKRKETHFGG